MLAEAFVREEKREEEERGSAGKVIFFEEGFASAPFGSQGPDLFFGQKRCFLDVTFKLCIDCRMNNPNCADTATVSFPRTCV